MQVSSAGPTAMWVLWFFWLLFTDLEQYTRMNDIDTKARTYARAVAREEGEPKEPDLESVEQQVVKFLNNKGISVANEDIEACSAAQLDVCGRPPMNPRIVGALMHPMEPGMAGQHPCWRKPFMWRISHQQPVGSECSALRQWLVASELIVYIGRKTQSGSNPYEISRSISQIFTHPNYGLPSMYNNDISLLKMASTVNFTTTSDCVFARLRSTLNAGSNVWTTGWGTTHLQCTLEFPIRRLDKEPYHREPAARQLHLLWHRRDLSVTCAPPTQLQHLLPNRQPPQQPHVSSVPWDGRVG
ncbi:hypothetical protein WMY93_001869 [Mugilogobius chulae]|uniref:Peptidase S1 domain-containing protein n=1 Tax=Mugilogobius chulae TaxID=88201 RepID=A0AAW0PS58_9GOBI